MSRTFHLISFMIFFSISTSLLSEEPHNYCSKINPLTNQCIFCLYQNILIPDENGDCVGSQKCFAFQNYCLECETEEKLCKTCDIGYYPDLNGACSYTDHCKISYKGECIECQEDFILVEKNKICKSLLSNDFENCKNIDSKNGLCQQCEEGYYLNKGDKKCIKTENCNESMFGICTLCNEGYYLDKKEIKCKAKKGEFLLCRQTIDGESCDLCDSGSYMDEEGICVNSNFCKKSSNGKCTKCIDDYYLSSNNGYCTNTHNCYIADKDTGLCLECNMYNYLDFKDFKCHTNLEYNDFRYCETVIDEKCIKCEKGYYLGKDNKCSYTPNCEEADNGKCVLCDENYYLGLDNYCSETQLCIRSRFNNCLECEVGYYYSHLDKKCLKSEGVEGLENCKYTCLNQDNIKCCECRDNYYLNSDKSLCLKNTEEGPLYKCRYAEKEEQCLKCIDGYYLGSEDKKCTLIANCKISENENSCLECDDYYCLDRGSGKCVRNDFLDDENIKTFFACKKTNEKGTECEQCIDGYEINEEGFCVDMTNCEEKKDGKCMKCNSEKSEKGYYYCSNDVFGCIEGHYENCIRCNNLLDLFECTECQEGYEKNQYGACKPK